MPKSRIPISTPAPGGLPNYLGIAWKNLVRFVAKRVLKFEDGEPKTNPDEVQLRFDTTTGILRGFDGKRWQTISTRTPEKHSIAADQLVVPSSMVGTVVLEQILPRTAVHHTTNSLQVQFRVNLPIDGIIVFSRDTPILTQRVDSFRIDEKTTTFYGPVFKEAVIEPENEVRFQCIQRQNIGTTLNPLERQKLIDIEDKATADQTAEEIIQLLVNHDKHKLPVTAIEGGITETERQKLADIEDKATADLTGEEIVAILHRLEDDARLDTSAVKGAITPQEREKLEGIASNATPDPTGAKIIDILENTDIRIPRNLVEGSFTNAEREKLAGIEEHATRPLNGIEIVQRLRTLASEDQLPAAAVIGTITETERKKLDGIDADATNDMTGDEILSAIRQTKNGLSIDDIQNAFKPEERQKLTDIEDNATADQTAEEIVELLENIIEHKLKSSAINWVKHTIDTHALEIPASMVGRVYLDQKYEINERLNQENRISQISDTEVHITVAHDDYKNLFGDEHQKQVDALLFYSVTGTTIGDQIAVMRVDTLEDVKFSWGMHLVVKGLFFTGTDNPNMDTDISATGSQLRVKFLRRIDIREEFSMTEREKLAGIDNGATDDQTGHEIIERLQRVPAEEQLPATAVRGTITSEERQKLERLPDNATGPPTETEILEILTSLHQQQKLPGQQ